MRAGQLLADRFQLLEEVHRGVMGVVFRAQDTRSGRPVAVKILDTVVAEDAARFAREAEALAELGASSGVVGYVAHYVPDEGAAYLAMEWLDGRDLRQRLRHGPLSIAETIALGRRLAATLYDVHTRGLVHRDLKPSNVFLRGDRAEDAVLIDFGVVLRESAPSEATSGVLVGTPAYMAPEQVRGERRIDARADLFGLGCVLYACLAGRPPFGGDSVVAVLAKILLEQPQPIEETRPGVPPVLASLVGKMLAKHAEQRPPHADAVRETLVSFGEGHVERATVRPVVAGALGLREQRFLTLLLARPRDGEPVRVGNELRALASSFGAHIERLIDGSIVAWIDAGAATDQASQAARLALALRPRVSRAPIVVATARGVVSERMPVGPVIDRAVALASGAGPSQIVLDEVTAGLLDERFEVRVDQGNLLVVERESASGERTLLGKPTPCVGREREISTLASLFEEGVGEPAARAVLVVGEAGIGKTRVRHELTRRIRESRPDAEVWTARGDPMSAGSPFGLVRRALRTAMGAREGDALEAQSLRLSSFVGRSVPSADLGHVGEFVGEIVGVSVAASPSAQLLAARANAVLMGDQLRRAFESLVVAECRAHPLVLVLEDLHWGDLPTVRLVDAALRAARDLPLFVFALARPEVHDRFPRLWEERGLSVVHIAGLGRKAAASLVREALGEVDEALVDRLVERAGGHAFTLEELVRAAAKGKADALPETVLAMMQGRVDDIAPEPRRLLRAASVFGAAFWAGGLAELVGRPNDEALASTLDDLAAHELVQRRGESRFRGESEWTFRHALLREAVYGTLTDEDRALGHTLAGQWLVRAGERDAVTIAEHFERGQDRAQAADWYLRASERALAGNDWRQAIGCAERGLPLAPATGADDEVRGALHLALAQACMWSGDVRRSEREAIQAAEKLERGSGAWFDAVAEVVTAAGMGLGHPDVARAWVDAMLDAWASRADVPAAAIAAARAITPMLLAGERTRAARLLELLERESLTGSPLAEAHLARARASWAFRGEKDLGAYVEYTRAGLDRLVAAGDERTLAQQRTNLGYGLTLLGAPETESVLLEGIAESERAALPVQVGTHKQNLGLVLARRGRVAEALAVERASIEAFREAGDRRFEAASHVYLSLILEIAGDFEGAASEAELALEMASSYPARRATAFGALAAARLRRGDVGAALEAARQGMALVAELGALEEGEEHLRATFAAALEASGATAEARAALDEARQRLLDRAAKIRDPRWRQSFLENVPENARLVRDG